MELSCSAICELFSAFPAVFPLAIAKDSKSVSGHAPSPSERCCTAGCCTAVSPNRYPSMCLRKLQNLQVSSAGSISLCTLNQQVKGRILLAMKEGHLAYGSFGGLTHCAFSLVHFCMLFWQK